MGMVPKRRLWPALTGTELNQLAIAHTICGVLAIILQVAVYICLALYNGAAYQTRGNLVFPLFSFGLIGGILYLATAYFSIQISRLLSLTANSTITPEFARVYKLLGAATILCSAVLIIGGICLMVSLSSWFEQQDIYGYLDGLNEVSAVGEAAFIFHGLHCGIAIVEVVLNIVSLLKCPARTPRTTLIYGPERGYAGRSQSGLVNGGLDYNGWGSNGFVQPLPGYTTF